MSIRPIRLFGDQVLRQKSVPVVSFDKELRDLVQDLTDTMIDANGGGIAAPQIGVGLRVFTYMLDGEIGHVVNPVVEVVGLVLNDHRETALPLDAQGSPCIVKPLVTTCMERRQSKRRPGMDKQPSGPNCSSSPTASNVGLTRCPAKPPQS